MAERKFTEALKESEFVKNAWRFVGVLLLAGVAITTVNHVLNMTVASVV